MKKFLSLVLALAMTMSLVTISAGAKDFTDADDITYVEAVEVMTAIGVVDGDTAGNFNPTAGLTRGAAAKIICNMILGPTTASALNADADPYKDVNKNSTFAGYIAFCAKEGIISGYADGTFKPAAPLTGYAFMKMLLGALGYDKSVEGYEGANWSINVAKRALNIGLDDGLVDTFNGSDYVTREEAMLYAFNTLQATMVEYDTTITIGDITVAGSKVSDVEYDGKYDGNIDNDGLLQFAEKYFTKLTANGAWDAFDRPATTWKNGTDKIGTYVWDADLEYTTEVNYGDVYSDLGLSSKTATTYYNINGVEMKDVSVSRGDKDHKFGANGVLTQVWYEEFADTNEYIFYVSEIDTYVAKVNTVVKATDSADRYITLAWENAALNPGTMVNKFETEDFAAKDLVTFTAAENDNGKFEIQEVAALELSTTGVVTQWKGATHLIGDKGTSESNFTVGGETYKYSANSVVDDENGGLLTNGIADFKVNESEINVYLDQYGYAIYVTGVENTINYAVVLGIGTANVYGSSTDGATLLFPDGTQKTVEYKMATGSGALTTANLANDGASDIVTYTIDDDGTYVLTLSGVMTSGSTTIYTGKYATDADTAVSGKYTSFMNGKSKMDIVTKAADSALATVGLKSYYTTSETIFVVATPNSDGSKDYNVYTGYANAPGLTTTVSSSKLADMNGIAFVTNKDYGLQLDIVYVDVDKTAGISGVDTYFVKAADSKVLTSSDGKYFELPAIVKGEETTVKVDAKATVNLNSSTMVDKNGTTLAATDFDKAVGLFAIDNVKTDKNGIITSFTMQNADTAFNAANGTAGTIEANKVVLGFGQKNSGETYWAYTADTCVYMVDDEYKTITKSSVASVVTDTNDKVYADYSTETGNKVLTDVIVVEQPAGVAQYTVTFAGVSGNAHVKNAAGTANIALGAGATEKVNDGSDLSFQIAPVAGKAVKEVKVGSTVLTAVDGVYTVKNVTADTTINVTFANVYTLSIKTSAAGASAIVSVNGVEKTVDDTGITLNVTGDDVITVVATAFSGSNTGAAAALTGTNATLWTTGTNSWKVTSVTGAETLALTLS